MSGEQIKVRYAVTSMELFHHFSTTPRYPNFIVCKVMADGEVGEQIARQANAFVASRHSPNEQALVQRGGSLYWRCEQEPPQESQFDDGMHWSLVKNRQEFAAPPVFEFDSDQRSVWTDPLRSRGFHVWCIVQPGEEGQPHSGSEPAGRTQWWVVADHTVSDGLGGVQYVSDLLIAVNNLRQARPPGDGLRRLDHDRMARRNDLGMLTRDYLRHWYKQPIAAFGLAKFFFRRFHVLTPQQQCDISDTSRPGVCGRWMGDDMPGAIATLAKSQSVSANTILISAMFYAVKAWLKRYRPDAEFANRAVRVVMPISLRNKSDLRLPVTNRATLVQIDRDAKQMQDPHSLMKYLDREIRIVVGWQFHKIFPAVIRLMSAVPGWLKRSARSVRPRGTIVFTNLGEPFRALDRAMAKDNAAEEIAVDPVGPIRAGMPINFTVHRRGDRYRLSAHFDRRLITREQAEAFLEIFERECRALMETTGEPVRSAGTNPESGSV